MVTGTKQGTSRENIYQELGLESIKSSRWYRHLSCMLKIMKKEAPNWLTEFQNVNELSEQGTTIYQPTTSKQIVSSILFFHLYPK